ncbi:hypothetical protein K435DRAFT_962158, partial [Dendrothele bispora CBS 962.96]
MACTAPIPIHRSPYRAPPRPFSPLKNTVSAETPLVFHMSPFEQPPTPSFAVETPPSKALAGSPATLPSPISIDIPVIKSRPLQKINGFTPEPCFSRSRTPERAGLSQTAVSSPTGGKQKPKHLLTPATTRSPSRAPPWLHFSANSHRSTRSSRPRNRRVVQPCTDSSDSDLDSDLGHDLNFDQVLAYRLERKRIHVTPSPRKKASASHF